QAEKIIRQVCQQDSEDDIELKESDQSPSPRGRRNFRDVHRTQYRGSADSQSAYKSKEDERRPTPGKRTAESRDEIKNGHYPQTVASSIAITGNRGQRGADQRADERAGRGRTSTRRNSRHRTISYAVFASDNT